MWVEVIGYCMIAYGFVALFVEVSKSALRVDILEKRIKELEDA